MKIGYRPAGQFEETRFEKIHNVIFESSQEASIIVAQEIANLINEKNKQKTPCVLGLATGSSPIKVYEELVHTHKFFINFRKHTATRRHGQCRRKTSMYRKPTIYEARGP